MNQEVRTRKEDLSLSELFSDLTRETGTLVRQEVALAKTELSEKAATVGKNAGFLVAGGAIAYAGLLALLAALILGITALGLPAWAAALIVGLGVSGVGGFLVWKGLQNFKQTDFAPKETIQSLQEDAKWAKEQIR